MFFVPAYHHPAKANAVHPVSTVMRYGRHTGIRLILTAVFCAPAPAQEPPPDLVKRVARQEAITQAERDQYTYRQTVIVEELDDKGGKTGEYREVRDIIFSPTQTRTEQVVGTPKSTLQRLKLTDEDFHDIREIQPFVVNEDVLFIYETKYRGVERVDDIDCYVLQVRPRQILQGMRLFDGLLWVSQSDYSIIRMEGQAVPQIRRAQQENLFPRFTTLRRPVDGKYWFPAHTYADDTLPFRSGPIRIRLTIRYTEYKRFGAESQIKFGETK
jgi:hypothetical protein